MGIDCRCCACWGWLVLGRSGGWGVHSCGWSRQRVAGVAARAAVAYVAACRALSRLASYHSITWRVATCHRRPLGLVVGVIDALDIARRKTVPPADPYP